MTGSLMGRGYQYTELIKILYRKLLTIRKTVPSFPHRVWGLNRRPQRCDASVLPLRYYAPPNSHFKWSSKPLCICLYLSMNPRPLFLGKCAAHWAT